MYDYVKIKSNEYISSILQNWIDMNLNLNFGSRDAVYDTICKVQVQHSTIVDSIVFKGYHDGFFPVFSV